MKNHPAIQEAQETLSLFAQKPEIDQKKEYYEEVLKNTERLCKAIDTEMAKEGKSEYEMATLKQEQLALYASIQTKKNFYEMWLGRAKEYEAKFEAVTVDCNGNFDLVLADFESMAKGNLALQSVIGKYNQETNGNPTQEQKNELFLSMKAHLTASKPAMSKVK